MPAKTFIEGNVERISVTFRDVDEVYYDPATVTCRTKDPNGIITTVGVIGHPSVGHYYADVEWDSAGVWLFEWKSTGGDSLLSGDVLVIGSAFDDPYRGRIARSVSSLMPLTWQGLSEAKYYGPGLLGQRILAARYSVLPAATSEADENTYSPLLTDYIAKICALDLITPGIEYWMRQKISIGTTGTNENISFGDPVTALKELAKRLTAEVASMSANPGIISLISLAGELPALSDNADGVFITENPYDMDPAFTSTVPGS